MAVGIWHQKPRAGREQTDTRLCSLGGLITEDRFPWIMVRDWRGGERM